MTAYLLAGPPAEPVTLGEAKAFLRVDGEDEDGLIATLIAAARIHVEGTTAQALIGQTWRLVLDAWPDDGVVRLPVAPAISLTAVTAYDAEGAEHEIALDQFTLEACVAPARLLLPAMVEGMPVLRGRQGIEIDYAAGYGTDPGDVPGDLRQAVLLLVAYWFEHRDAVVPAGPSGVAPSGFERIVAPYRRVRL